MLSTTALLNSRPVSVVVRALSRAKVHIEVPARKDSDVDWANNEMREAAGLGSNVPLGVLTG